MFSKANVGLVSCYRRRRRAREVGTLRKFWKPPDVRLAFAAFQVRPIGQFKSVRPRRAWCRLAPVGRKNDCLERHPTRIAAEFLTQSLRQGVDDSIRIDAAARLYLVN